MPFPVPDDLLPPNPGPGDDPPPTPRPVEGRRITCDFCRCSLAPSGDVLKMSAEAKTFRDQSDTIEKLRRDLELAAGDVQAAIKERDEARAQIPKKRSMFEDR